MANNLYLGTALTRDLKVDNSGQDALLDIAKSGAAQRAKAAADKEKQRAKTEKDVLKNMAIESNLSTPYYQRAFSKKMSEKMATIVEAAKNGDENLAVLGNQAKQQMLNYVGALRAADSKLQTTLTNVAKEPELYAFNDEQLIGGKKVNNFYEAINDPYADTPEGMAEIMSKYGGTEYSFQQGTPELLASGMPEMLVGYNPVQMVDPFDSARDIAKTKELFTEIRQGKTIPLRGGKAVTEFGYAIPQAELDIITENIINDQGVLRHYEEQLYREQKAVNPELSKAEFLKTDWVAEVPNRIEKDVKGPLGNMLTKQSLTPSAYIAPKATKPTPFENNFELPTVATQSIFNVGGKDASFRKASLKPKKSPSFKPYTPSLNAIVSVGDGKLENAAGEPREVFPSGIASSKGQSYLVFDVKGGSELFEPISSNTFQEWVDRSLINRDDAFKVARLAHKSSDLGIISDFIKEMTGEGITPDEAGEPKGKSIPSGITKEDVDLWSTFTYKTKDKFDSSTKKAIADKIRALPNVDEIWKEMNRKGLPKGMSDDELLAGFIESKYDLKKLISSSTPDEAGEPNNKIKLDDIPVGAKIETKDGKNYYNGKEVVM